MKPLASAVDHVLPVATFMLLALAPFAMPSGYSILRHSISESAGQGVPFAWIARTGLALFGVTAGWATMRAQPLPHVVTIAVLGFGLCMIASAIWSHGSWQAEPPANPSEHARHSLAAQLAGLCLVVALAARMIECWQRREVPPIAETMTAAAVLGGSASFALFPSISGLCQRLMFGIVLAWLWLLITHRL